MCAPSKLKGKLIVFIYYIQILLSWSVDCYFVAHVFCQCAILDIEIEHKPTKWKSFVPGTVHLSHSIGIRIPQSRRSAVENGPGKKNPVPSHPVASTFQCVIFNWILRSVQYLPVPIMQCSKIYLGLLADSGSLQPTIFHEYSFTKFSVTSSRKWLFSQLQFWLICMAKEKRFQSNPASFTDDFYDGEIFVKVFRNGWFYFSTVATTVTTFTITTTSITTTYTSSNNNYNTQQLGDFVHLWRQLIQLQPRQTWDSR